VEARNKQLVIQKMSQIWNDNFVKARDILSIDELHMDDQKDEYVRALTFLLNWTTFRHGYELWPTNTSVFTQQAKTEWNGLSCGTVENS